MIHEVKGMTKFFIIQMALNYSKRFGYPFGEKKYVSRCETCGRPIGGPVLPISIRFKGRVNDADFIPSPPELLVRDRVRQTFEKHNIRGVDFFNVIVKYDNVKAPLDLRLWHLLIHKGAHAARQMNIAALQTCSGCGIVDFSTWENGVVIDAPTWDGSDIFRLHEDVVGIVVTEKVKQIVEENGFTGVQFIPAEEFHDPYPESRPRPPNSN